MAVKKKAKKAPAKKKAGTSKASAAARRKLFVEAFIANGGNKTQAAVSAGYKPGRAAEQAGLRMSKDVVVQQMIAERAKETADRYELTTDLVTKSIVQELRFDPKKLYNTDGTLKAITELDDDTAAALAGVEFVQLGSPDAPVFVRKYKWAPKAPARDQAMRHLGMFEKDNTQRSGLLGELPRELVQAIVERLRGSGGR